MSSSPLVSIVTPAFNAVSLLRETMDSVRAQTYSHHEHIVVDDCSNDGTRELIQRLAIDNQRVKPILLDTNSGPVVARNIGLRHATGKYVAFLDADDLWRPDKLALQVALMEETGAALSFTDYRHMSADGARVGPVIKGPRSISLATHYRTRFLCCSSVMIALEQVPGFAFPAIAPAIRAEDFVAWAALIKARGAARRCPHDQVRYRLMPGSRSASKLRAVASVWHLYRGIERMSLPSAFWNFVLFLAAAGVKHTWGRPRFARNSVDGATPASSPPPP